MEKQSLGSRFFRQVLRHPFVSALIVGLLILVAVVAFAGIKYGLESKIAENSFGFGLLGGFISFVVLAIVGCILQNKHITYICEGDTNVFLIRISPEGAVVEIGQTMWGKEGIYRIQEPTNLKYDKNSTKCGFTTGTEIVSRHHNSETVIPVSIEVLTNGDYDHQELYDRMVVGMGILSVADFTQKILLAPAEANREVIDQATKEYAEKKISAAQLLEKVIEVLEFPERALKNFKDVKICLENPTARTCKGTTCEQI